MRRFASLFLALVLLEQGFALPASVGSIRAIVAVQDVSLGGGDGDGETAEDAAKAIARARDRANAAVDAWSVAQTRLDLLMDEKDQLDAQVAELQQQVDDLQVSVEALAVSQYLGTGTIGIDLLTGNVAPTEQAQMAVLVGIVNDSSAISVDDYDSLRKLLDGKKDAVRDTVADLEAAQADFEAAQLEAEAEVERLRDVEKGRLNDEAVLRALEATRQKEIEAAERAASEQLARDQAAALAAEERGADGGDEGLGAVAENSASSGSSGGTTGGGGAGARPIFGAGVIYGQGEAWVCPVQGVTAFGDTYGAPRSGGRTHQGVDMISPTGTEIVAVVDGEAIPHENALGGTTVSLYGTDGNRYYYAHLDRYGQLGIVPKGSVIGYVGATGNAQFSTAHLHFEIHPANGAAVNPYPTVAANC